jgi:hypothetical protein
MLHIPEGEEVLQGEELELIIHGKATLSNIEMNPQKYKDFKVKVPILAYGYIYHCDGPMPHKDKPYRLNVYDRWMSPEVVKSEDFDEKELQDCKCYTYDVKDFSDGIESAFSYHWLIDIGNVFEIYNKYRGLTRQEVIDKLIEDDDTYAIVTIENKTKLEGI